MRALHTDLYQLTMAAGYFHRNLADRTMATCELFVRRLPKQRRYLVASGIDRAIDYIKELRFSSEDIDYLRGLPNLREAMSDDFVAYLRNYRFRGDVWAVPEGTVMFGGEPFLRVRAPIIEAQLVETHILSTINHATMIASKAARIVHAAAGRGVLEFGTRRTHPDAAVDAAYGAYLVGAQGTSNLEAGRRYGIPVLGTAAHMWTMTHDSERAAFENYVATFPSASTLLIDTYDTVRGAERAAAVARDKLAGVRLDSGDLGALSKQVRAVLDSAGCQAAKIVASGDLNEYKIRDLLAAGAPIDLFGVGTELVCSKDEPSLGGVYKIVQYERDGKVVPIAKFSAGKATYPGPHQVHRAADGDTLALADEDIPPGAKGLLVPRLRAGETCQPAAAMEAAREHAMKQLHGLSSELLSLEPLKDRSPTVALSAKLQELVAQVKARMVEEG